MESNDPLYIDLLRENERLHQRLEDARSGLHKHPLDQKSWADFDRLKKQFDKVNGTLTDARHLVKCCEYGEEKHTIGMLRELLGV